MAPLPAGPPTRRSTALIATLAAVAGVAVLGGAAWGVSALISRVDPPTVGTGTTTPLPTTGGEILPTEPPEILPTEPPEVQPTKPPEVQPTKPPGGEVTTGAQELQARESAGTARRYELFVYQDPEAGIELFRTLVPSGWKPQGLSEWSIPSAVSPAWYEFHAMSDDELASISILSDYHYAYRTLGGEVIGNANELGAPIAPPMTNAQWAEQVASKMTGIENLTLGKTENVDKDKSVEKSVLAGQAEALAAWRQVNDVDDQIVEVTTTTGSATKKGTPLKVSIVTLGYQLDMHATGTAPFHTSLWTKLATFVIVAPDNEAGLAQTADISSMLDSFVVNATWVGARDTVSQHIFTKLIRENNERWEAVRQQRQALMASLAASWQNSASDWSASRVEATDKVSQGWDDALSGNERYVTPDGGTIAVENKWDHVWQSESGAIYGTNSALDNPGAGWSQLDKYSLSSG